MPKKLEKTQDGRFKKTEEYEVVIDMDMVDMEIENMQRMIQDMQTRLNEKLALKQELEDLETEELNKNK